MVCEMGYKTNVGVMVMKELISYLLEEGLQLSDLSAGIFRTASCGDLIDSPTSLWKRGTRVWVEILLWFWEEIVCGGFCISEKT